MISGSTKFGSSVVSGFCFCHLLSLYLQSVVGLSKLQLNSAWNWHETNHKLTYNPLNNSLCSSRNRSTHDKNLVCIHCRIVSMCNAVSNSQHGQIQLPAEAKATNSATKGPPWIALKLVLVRPRNLCIVPMVNVQFSRLHRNAQYLCSGTCSPAFSFYLVPFLLFRVIKCYTISLYQCPILWQSR